MPASETIAPPAPPRPALPEFAQPSAHPAEPAPRAGAAADLRRKVELELAMLAAPQDQALRASYFKHLGRIAVTYTGLQTAMLPDVGTPVFFRCGTPDIAVLANIFRDDALAFEMKPTPLRILVLGAYAGFSSVDLARRFPRAQVLAVEPLADNFRLLSLNTAAWRQVRVANVAVWHHQGRLAPTLRFQADWAIRLHDEEEVAERTVNAITVQDLLGRAGWPAADLVVCDISGSEREVFADPMAPWLDGLDAALVRLHEPMAPRATEWVNAALDAAVFEHRKVGDMELYVRRTPRQSLGTLTPELPLVRAEPGLTPFALGDVTPASFGFFVFDGSNCQLHPNPPGQKPARAIFTLHANGQRRFVAGVAHAGRPSHPIVFAAAVQREDGTLAGQGDVTVKQRESGQLSIDLGGPVTGKVLVALQTLMAPGAPNANMAWARWLNPRLV